jgi:hypothetical protein
MSTLQQREGLKIGLTVLVLVAGIVSNLVLKQKPGGDVFATFWCNECGVYCRERAYMAPVKVQLCWTCYGFIQWVDRWVEDTTTFEAYREGLMT